MKKIPIPFGGVGIFNVAGGFEPISYQSPPLPCWARMVPATTYLPFVIAKNISFPFPVKYAIIEKNTGGAHYES